MFSEPILIYYDFLDVNFMKNLLYSQNGAAFFLILRDKLIWESSLFSSIFIVRRWRNVVLQ